MRKAFMVTMTGILLGMLGCGGSETSSNGNGGGASGTGGAIGSGGSTANPTGGSMVPEGCNLPPCLATVMEGCAPSGTCVEQSSGFFDSNTCYSNGVKEITKMNLNMATGTGDVSVTYKKNNAVCYSFNMPMTASTTNATIQIKNGAGTTIATIEANSTTDKSTITCTGGQPVVLNDKCDKSMLPDVSGSTDTTDSCTPGTCTP